MGFSRGNMRVLSFFQLGLALLFFIFGLVDRFQVKTMYSFVVMPCWTSFFLMLSGVVGLVAVSRGRPPSSTVLNMAWSLSVGSVILTALIIFVYMPEISDLASTRQEEDPFTGKEGSRPFSKEESKQLGILCVILILALAEMITGLGIAANCREGYESYMRFGEPTPGVAAPQASQVPNAVVQQKAVVTMPVGSIY